MTGRVIVVGSVNVDFVVGAPRLPRPGETVVGGRFERHHGGKGANQAVAAARLGARVELVAAVGSDGLADDARAALEAEGIGLAELATAGDTATGVALIVVDPSGENLISVAPGANASLTAAGVGAALARLAPGPGDVLLAGCEVPPQATLAALSIARRTGATTILNPAPADGVDRRALGLVDVLTPNRGELAELVAADKRRTGRSTGRGAEPPERAARSLLEANAQGPGVAAAVIVTLGAQGALLVRPEGEAIELLAPPVEAVDAVGAGDAFSGALAATLAAGREIGAAARVAVAAASLATTRHGARSGMPNAIELERAVDSGP